MTGNRQVHPTFAGVLAAVAPPEVAQAILGASTPPPLSRAASDILNDVLVAMQGAEELGGPEGLDYLSLMQAIKAEAEARSRTFLSHWQPEKGPR